MGWNWAYSELVYPTKGITFAYREDDERVVHIVKDKLGREDASFLFDVVEDPYEQDNRLRERHGRYVALRKKMGKLRDSHERKALGENRVPLDTEAEERLRALGYIE